MFELPTQAPYTLRPNLSDRSGSLLLYSIRVGQDETTPWLWNEPDESIFRKKSRYILPIEGLMEQRRVTLSFTDNELIFSPLVPQDGPAHPGGTEIETSVHTLEDEQKQEQECTISNFS